MTQPQYGAQGSPISLDFSGIHNTEPKEAIAIYATPAATEDTPPPRAVPVPMLHGLVNLWEDAAATTLLRSDYMKGQRDAVLACIGDLRKIIDAAL